MSKKILTVLAPVAALIALAVVPSMAQALTVQSGGTKLTAPAAITGTATKELITKTTTGGEPEGEIKCKKSTFTGTYTGNEADGSGGENAMGDVETDTLSECTAGGLKADVTTNAGELKEGVHQFWQLTIQQPDAKGNVVAHLQPSPHPSNPAKVIQFTGQVQLFGGSVTTCDYSATDIQFEGTEASNEMTITGSNQFTRQAGASPCGEVGSLSGAIALTNGGNKVTVDMT